MEQRKKAIICLEGLGKQFQTTNGTVTALDDINLEILQGEIFGIIGLSGAGKSTLVRCINYLETPTAGRVIFEGQNLSMMKEAEIRKARQSMGMTKREVPKEDGADGETVEETVLTVTSWPEPYGYNATPEEEKTRKEFPFSEEGIVSGVEWLNGQHARYVKPEK